MLGVRSPRPASSPIPPVGPGPTRVQVGTTAPAPGRAFGGVGVAGGDGNRGTQPHPPARAAPPAFAAVVALAKVQRHRDEVPMRRRRRWRIHDSGGSGPGDTAHWRRQVAGLCERPEALFFGHPRAAIAAPATPRPSRSPPMRLCRALVTPLRVRPSALLLQACLRPSAHASALARACAVTSQPRRWRRPAPAYISP